MKPVFVPFLALAITASVNTLASDPLPLQLKVPKSAIAPALVTHTNAPFNTALGEPDLGLVAKQEAPHQESRSACAKASTLCYDAFENRIVFKPARAFMPDLPGMTRENITVKRDRIVFRYSF